MDDIYIPDGYNFAKTFPAQTGMHPEVQVLYRPAPALERNRMSLARDAEALTRIEDEILGKYVKMIAGQPFDAKRPLRPQLRLLILNAVLGYSGSDEERKDLGN
jgi:hypothetical protein